MHLLVTRPEADARTLAARLEAAGHTVTIAPLLTIAPVGDAEGIDLDGVQALIVTSRNALQVLGDSGRLADLRHLPLLAVGAGSASAARSAGFGTVFAGPAAAADLVAVARASLDPAAGALLHLSGEQVAFDLEAPLAAAGFTMRRAVVYRSVPAETLTDGVQHLLRAGAIDAVLLMSPRTAEVYVRLIEAHRLQHALPAIAHLCLSDAIADRLAPLGSTVKAVCSRPSLEEMLALVAREAAELRAHRRQALTPRA